MSDLVDLCPNCLSRVILYIDHNNYWDESKKSFEPLERISIVHCHACDHNFTGIEVEWFNKGFRVGEESAQKVLAVQSEGI
ncbi:MAG: hypothetical protein WC437_00175 [Patescibacteria group bacterium]